MSTQITSVCHVVRRFVPEKWGGTESVVMNYSIGLTNKGIINRIFCTNIFSKKAH